MIILSREITVNKPYCRVSIGAWSDEALEKRSQTSSIGLTIGNDGIVGQIQIGTPGQSMDVQFDSTFNGVMVQSDGEEPIIGGGFQYNHSISTTFRDTQDFAYVEGIGEGAVAVAFAGNETVDIGGTLFSEVPFGEMFQYNRLTSGRLMPFNGASGVIGLGYKPVQGSGQSSFMYAIKDQLQGWVCTLDSYRAWNNGTLTIGATPSLQYADEIAWVDRNPRDDGIWSINITAVSSGGKIDPSVTSWSASVSTEVVSLVWPQRLLDWYFAGISGAAWSPNDVTYRYPCNTTLPDFQFALGNGTFTIPGSYLPYQRDESGTTCITLVTGDNSTESDHEYSFGMWWSQIGVLIFDYENGKVGFANKTMPLPVFAPSSLQVITFT
ncbi:Penicillopepsin [Talaromyces islandicus]|uniref:Penicillopepsin n=1 Tax=Talaromyces islandicus TaxID=28573 RepID=A0A0U1MBD3_TALIS|nr:Penicillopepsin [Talaromyces islandicus]